LLRFRATDLSAVKGLVQAQIDVACGDANETSPGTEGAGVCGAE
jgi:hypothetical protein